MNSTSSKGYSTISDYQKGYEIPRKQVPPLPTALSGKAWGRAAKKAGWVALATAAVVMAALSLGTFVDARLALLEAQNSRLGGQVSGLTGQVAGLNGQVAVLEANNSRLGGQVSGLTGQVAGLNGQVAVLEAENQDFKHQLDVQGHGTSQALDSITASLGHRTQGSGRANVNFLARGIDIINITPGNGEVLAFPEVVHNAGGGYNATTGRFTAPTAGTYVVLAGLLVARRHAGWRSVYVHLIQDGEHQLLVRTEADRDDDSVTCSVQVVLRLGKGQQLWLQAYSGSRNDFVYCSDGCNWFSAALLAADP